jgi:hypothetical protein
LLATSLFSQFGPVLSTLLIVAGLIAVYGLFYFLLWLNRARLYDTPSLEEMAYLMQQDALEALGEREFSRRLLDFEQSVAGDLNQALQLLATTQDITTRQIGYCWLCRQGYGKMKVTWLWSKLEKYGALSRQELSASAKLKQKD